MFCVNIAGCLTHCAVDFCHILFRLFAYVCEYAAVNVEYVAVDEVGCGGCKEYGRTHQVFRSAPAGCRGIGADEKD